MEKTYILTESQLLSLLIDSLSLSALEEGGVDSWSWYSEAYHDYIKRSKRGILNGSIQASPEVREKAQMDELYIEDIATAYLKDYKSESKELKAVMQYQEMGG